MLRTPRSDDYVCYRPGADGPLGRRSGFWYGRCLSSLRLSAVRRCLSLVGPRICWRVGGTRDVPVEALFPEGRERFELAFLRLVAGLGD